MNIYIYVTVTNVNIYIYIYIYIRVNDGALTWWSHHINTSLHNPISNEYCNLSFVEIFNIRFITLLNRPKE